MEYIRLFFVFLWLKKFSFCIFVLVFDVNVYSFVKKNLLKFMEEVIVIKRIRVKYLSN